MQDMATNRLTLKCRKKFIIRRYIFVALFLAYVGVTFTSLILKSDYLRRNSKYGKEDLNNNDLTGSLHRIKRDTVNGSQNFEEDDEDEKNETCTKRAIEEFPDNFFTLQQTKGGGIAAHIAISLYMFGALAIVCDDYFVSSLEVICERLKLQEDVAGATFMAAGSSAPEFFTSVIGVFIAKNDVGVGTIVGSAVFNILFIIGTCSIFAGMVVKLTWYPMTRDCLFYLLSIAALVIVINDDKVYWYEATVFLVMYLIYITIMYFNRVLEDKSIECVKKILHRCRGGDALSHHKGVESDEKQPLSEGKVAEQHTAIRITAGENSQSGTYTEEKTNIAADTNSEDKETTFSTEESEGNPHVHVDDKKIDSPWDVPEHILGKIYWAVMLPMKCLMFVTIPDCRRHGIWRRLYMVTFVLSIAWIAACSYLMVWMVTIIGDALEIPDTVMGLTILAAGTSVPDCLSSVFVARDGYGDMAVSNSIGSNVFDILVCLGLPWLLNTAIVENGAPLRISSGGIAYSALILLSTVVFMLVAINLAKWKLNKPFGFLCMFAYVIVIALSCLFELNVFGQFVDPSCPRPE